jgi:hypothetical protein
MKMIYFVILGCFIDVLVIFIQGPFKSFVD